jgi:catechol 2,3-dioxygenase-like lactoylglutathione lyase family enzyme
MEPRITLVTLGVIDLERSLRFYRDGLGWRPSSASVEGDVAFFQVGPLALALWSRAELAKDAGIYDGGGWGGVALAHNVRSLEEADAALARAVEAGGRLLKPAAATEWGGYSGYIADPDGHPWEIAWNPSWPIEADGSIRLPE